MFRICLVMLAGLAVTLLTAGPAAAEKVEVKGPQRTVNIEGTGLDRGEVIEALRKAGFNGTVEK